jgi:hypothetical protein
MGKGGPKQVKSQGAGGLRAGTCTWRNQYGGMKTEDVKRLKELEKENCELKGCN